MASWAQCWKAVEEMYKYSKILHLKLFTGALWAYTNIPNTSQCAAAATRAELFQQYLTDCPCNLWTCLDITQIGWDCDCVVPVPSFNRCQEQRLPTQSNAPVQQADNHIVLRWWFWLQILYTILIPNSLSLNSWPLTHLADLPPPQAASVEQYPQEMPA